MKGLLVSEGIVAGERQVGVALRDSNPLYHEKRRTRTAVSLNTKPYLAQFAGHKLHVDQNEKLVMFGVTHVCAVDGYSGKIVAFGSMPIKNNVEIYENIFR